ncbi:MAG: hypothetical protein R3B09_16535 [Nannocystaceae bacterium]
MIDPIAEAECTVREAPRGVKERIDALSIRKATPAADAGLAADRARPDE